jgi:hypothetical protein
MNPVRFLLTTCVSILLCACASRPAGYSGRWISKETVVGDFQPAVVERTLTLGSDGHGQLVIKQNNRVVKDASGTWGIQADILHLDTEKNQSIYLRILRLTTERLVVRTEEGNERIYDRVQ